MMDGAGSGGSVVVVVRGCASFWFPASSLLLLPELDVPERLTITTIRTIRTVTTMPEAASAHQFRFLGLGRGGRSIGQRKAMKILFEVSLDVAFDSSCMRKRSS